jgi:hypothetical protein
VLVDGSIRTAARACQPVSLVPAHQQLMGWLLQQQQHSAAAALVSSMC